MGEIRKGNYTLSMIESTHQFTIKGNGFTDGRVGADTDTEKSAKDIIDLCRAYLLITKTTPTNKKGEK